VASGYLTDMLVVRADGFVDPCIPSRAPKPPSGPDCVHEIKHDGYRLIVRRDGDVVRLFTRRGYDWTDRYPAIASAAAKLKARSFTLDGEAVVAGADGVALFDALHRRGRVADAILQAFDLLELDGEDLRPLPLVAIPRHHRRAAPKMHSHIAGRTFRAGRWLSSRLRLAHPAPSLLPAQFSQSPPHGIRGYRRFIDRRGQAGVALCINCIAYASAW
jgi:ATP dependent DNA ligase domain